MAAATNRRAAHGGRAFSRGKSLQPITPPTGPSSRANTLGNRILNYQPRNLEKLLEIRVSIEDTALGQTPDLGQTAAAGRAGTRRVRFAQRRYFSFAEFFMPGFLRPIFLAFVLLAVIFGCSHPVHAQSVWSGFSHSFEKFDFADPNLPANQDRITDNVWLTRGTNGGLFNARSESSYSPPPPVGTGSPAGTRWATTINNPSKSIVATNWSNLAFTDWNSAYGGQGTMNLPNQLLTYNAVVHLMADDTYLDLRFTTWHGAGGGFAYERAPAPPPLTTGDYNLNGVVDAADYVLWRETLGQAATPSGSGADGNANGTIDSGDYDFWRARFGDIVAGPATGSRISGATVPEPVGTLLCCAILAAIAARRPRGRT